MVVVVTVDAHDNKRMLLTGRREGNAIARPAPALDDKKAEEEKKAREKRLGPQSHSAQANRDPFASSRFETSRPSPDMLRYLRAKRP
jgi:hypothetical protein